MTLGEEGAKKYAHLKKIKKKSVFIR